MYLQSVKVQHYKSLDDVSVNLEKDVTVIVGPNGVGKSNFVDVLRFLRDAVADDLEHAVTKREGIGRLLQTYKTKPYKIGMECGFLSLLSDDYSVGHYKMRLKAVGKSNYAVESEDAMFIPLSNPPGPDRGLFSVRDSRTTISPDALAISAADHKNSDAGDFGGVIAEHITGWSFCTIYPNTLKKPALPVRDSRLMESGDNWASVIKALKRSPKGRDALERIYAAMRTVLPTFEEVSVQTVGSYLVPLFKFRVEGDSALDSFDPVQLSDGTLRLFGILLAAYQLPRPKLLVIEEPEQTIYPGALAVLADVFKEVGKSTQVLITTHSPHLVQFFEPSQIRVAVLHKGITQIRPIHPFQIEAVNDGLLSLEEFMTTEGLRPDDTSPSPT